MAIAAKLVDEVTENIRVLSRVMKDSARVSYGESVVISSIIRRYEAVLDRDRRNRGDNAVPGGR